MITINSGSEVRAHLAAIGCNGQEISRGRPGNEAKKVHNEGGLGTRLRKFITREAWERG